MVPGVGAGGDGASDGGCEMNGRRFGRLVVVGEGELAWDGVRRQKRRMADVVCDCGTRRSVRVDHLLSGSVTSCGNHRPPRLGVAERGPCIRGHAPNWVMHKSGQVKCRDCAKLHYQGKQRTRTRLIEQGIARGESLEEIAAQLRISVEVVYKAADAMDRAVAS